MRPKPLVLVILDGWGYSGEAAHNAIAQAHTPVWDALVRDYPHGLINASEKYVGLPAGQMGNSEVGHMNIGSGRVVMQDLPRIDATIEDGSLTKNPKLLEFIATLKQSGGVCHLMGLLSPGGVHSHQHHIAVLANIIAKAGVPVAVHAILDGRDTPPQSALGYLKVFNASLRAKGEAIQNAETNWIASSPAAPRNDGAISIATLSGRYYAMDRDKRWERVQKAYDTITAAAGERFATAADAVEKSYAAGISDEFIVPCAIGDYTGINDGDGLLMANFRADRVREILTVLLDPAFKEFPRPSPSPLGGGSGWGRNMEKSDHLSKIAPLPPPPLLGDGIKFSAALGMTEYSERLSQFIPALFPPQPLANIFGEIIAKAGMKQLRIAETEKYAHVTFFFNGGREEPFPGEERILVPSPKVATYDLKPEMSACEVTDKLLEAIASERFDVIIVNYANTDMVGHSGDMNAAIKAVEAVDACLGRLSKAVLEKGGGLLITADHGNAEEMFDEETHQPHTAHTLNLVPVIMIGERLKKRKLTLPEGRLADVAPTLLQWLGLPQPAEMTGTSLLVGCGDVGIWGCGE